jgi:two-component system invasion response regulator UvrY
MSSIRVLLVDDNPKFIAAATHFLATMPGVTVAGSALSGREGLAQIANLQPNLVLMDIAMPKMSGLEATRQVKEQPHAPYVVILTMHDNPEYRAAAEIVGADGFITKSEFGAQLPSLIYSLFNSCKPDTLREWADPSDSLSKTQ